MKTKITKVGIYQEGKNVELKINDTRVAFYPNCTLQFNPMDCSLMVKNKKGKIVCTFEDSSEYADTIEYDTNIEI